MELGPKKNMFFFYDMFFSCVVGCGRRSLSRRVPCPLLKVVLEAKQGPIYYYYYYFILLFPIFSIKIIIFPIFSIKIIIIFPIFSIKIIIIIIVFILNYELKYDQYFPFRATSVHFVASS